MIQALSQTTWRIVFDPSFVSGKKRKQVRQLETKYGDSDWLNLVCCLDDSIFGQESFWSCVNLVSSVDQRSIPQPYGAQDVP